MLNRLLAKASIIALGVAAPGVALAQGAASALSDEILVTATKGAQAENVQDVPLAVTAYGEAQLSALKVRDLESLSYSVPNVSLDDIGTAPNVANFSIRGLGINSSIPSIDPTVGVFVDGVYLGINGGVVLDIFDLESIEVLRGPQGILFGRNTTGGAVLINTKRPSDEWEADFKGAIESGMRGTGTNWYGMAAIGGPLFGDSLRAKVAVYYNKDNGWWENYLGGPFPNAVAVAALGPVVGGLVAGPGTDAFEDFGEAKTLLIRPSIYWTPTDTFEVIVRYEHSDSETDGPAAQNHTGFAQPPYNPITMMTPSPVPSTNVFFSAPRDSFDFSINERGFTDGKTDSVTAEARLDLGGSGVFTNIFGWRDFGAVTRSDIDGTPLSLFHASATTDQDQISEEIRYNNRFFDAIDTTLGFFYFTQDIAYNEIRNILGPVRFFNGGGVQDQKTWAFFGQFDIDFSDRFTINLGARYTHEEKDVVISNLLLNSNVPAFMNPSPACDVRISGDCTEDFVDSDSWNNFTPKAGFEWAATDFMNIYGHWTKGVRSGGYNFRNTSLAFPPGPFEEEKVTAWELGFKAQPGDGMATINAALYLNDIEDMQREINLADPLAGVVQVIRNTADATIWGFEIEAQVAFTDNFVFLGSLGYTDGEYDRVLFDLNSDGVIGDDVNMAFDDRKLEIPRLAPFTYGAGFVHTLPLGGETTVDTRFNYSHRDMSFYTDNNLGFLNEVDIIDASVALNFGSAILSIYGKNLTNEVNFGGDTQLPGTLGGGTFSPLAKGRRVGVELEFGF